MSQLYSIYRARNIALARSLVLKFEADIEGTNLLLEQMGVNQGDNESQWKYYKNLAGEYGPLDKPMVVVSSDTQTTISFDKVTLRDHPLTRSEYTPGTRGYLELAKRYPEQKTLIARILNPVDKIKAIQAKPFEILQYDTRLVADNETNLIPQLQEWIYRFVDRWYVRSMGISDRLYHADFIGKLFIFLPNVINSIRIANIGTPYVSNWHLWVYLGGHLGLDRFQESLSLEQALYLYRNIRKIRRNAGADGQFRELTQVILDKAGLSAYRYDMLKLDQDLLMDGQAIPRFNRSLVRSINPDIDEVALSMPIDMVSLTSALTRANNAEVLTDAEILKNGITGTVVNDSTTNIIEVSQRAGALSRFGTTIQSRMDYWVRLSAIGQYTGSFSINIPGRNNINISPKDAFILFMYSSNMMLLAPREGVDQSQFEPTEILPVRLNRVIPDMEIDRDQIRRVLDEAHVDIEAFISQLYDNRLSLPYIDSLNELEQFAILLGKQQEREYLMIDHAKSNLGRAMIRQAVDDMYIDMDVRFAPEGTTFDSWFDSIDFNRIGLTHEDYAIITRNILAELSGITEENASLPEYQLDMIEIMRILSSYNLLFVEGEAYAFSRGIDWYFSDIGNLEVTNEIKLAINSNGVRVNTGIGHGNSLDTGGIVRTTANRIEDRRIYDTEGSLDIGISIYQDSSQLMEGYARIGTDIHKPSFSAVY